MKSKLIIILFIYIILNNNVSFSQQYPCDSLDPLFRTNVPTSDNFSQSEIQIYNQILYFDSDPYQPIKVKIIPVGIFFNRNYLYNPDAISISTQTIAGTEFEIPLQLRSDTASYIAGNWDFSYGNANQSQFSYGYGKYKFEFYRWEFNSTINSHTWILSDYLYFDINDLSNNIILPPGSGGSFADMRIDYFSKDSITFQYQAGFGNEINHSFKYWNIDLINRDMKFWDKFIGTCIPAFTPDRGAMKSDASNNNEFLSWPIDANLYNGDIGQENAGDLYMNLEIQNNHYARINRGIPFSVNESAKLSLKHSDTYANNARLYVENNSEFRVRNTASLEIKKYGNVILESGGQMFMENNSNIIFQDHGEIILNSGGTLYNCGANIINNSSACILIHNGGNYLVGSQYCIPSVTHNFNDGAFLIVDGGNLTIGDSSKIVFDGASSFLRINPQSKIFLGENASIEFKNGAYISANGCTFNSLDSLKNWKGIVLENSGIDSIVNCTFSNAKTSITIKNADGFYVNRVINNNTFNIPAGVNNKGIYGENNYKILIQDNTFNMPVNSSLDNNYYTGIFLKNVSNYGEPESAGQIEEEAAASPYSLNIINNKFKNGTGSMILANYITNFLPYYIKGNEFDSASSVNILGVKITGTIRDNVSSDFVTPIGMHLVNSSPNLYNNTIISRDVSLHLLGKSYPNLSPYVYGNQLTWTGGKNRLTAKFFDNIQLVSKNNVYTDFGENRFMIFDTASSYHIYGWLDSTISKYAGRNNCWYPGNTAKIYLRQNYSSNPVPTVTGVTTIDCDHEIDPNGWSVDYLGNGIYDSTKQSVNNTGNVPAEEDLIYEQAYNYYNNSLYLDAIGSFKDLINTYYEYENLPKSTLDLYSCYEYLDTSLTQSERNTLFGNLKIFAEEKISSGNYKNEEFLDNCFDVITMCEAKLENYDAASNNYEFIALYHPDPDVRLNASWNYTEVQALMNSGNGGGKQFQITNDKLQIEELKELRELKRINEIISNDPVMSKIKKSYEKNATERIEKIEKKIQYKNKGKSSAKVSEYIRKSKELDNAKEIKAKRNLFELRNLDNENLEKRRIEDLMLSTRIIQNEPDNDEVVSVPNEYSLSQNYPNPFNPTTNLEFGISELGFVKLKIYDMLGKEIKTLVNETKPAGKYTVTFDGSNLPSGIYFYKIEAGDFTQVKKMMLIK
jgi:hypothetical protein